MKSLKFLLASSVLALSTGATEAQAATADTAVPSTATAPAPAPADPIQSDNIVVTARHSNERLQDIPLSINAQTAAQLAERNITDLQGVARYTPGLQFKDFVTAFNGSATIRGQTQTNVQNAVGNVGTFVDGIYLQRGYLINGALGDWERIEVVKGPQSALYGANTFSGAINYVTAQPSDTFKANASVTGGNAGIRQVSAAVGGPIIPGILDARIYGAKEESNGTWKNNLPGASGKTSHFGAYDRDAFSGSLKFTPTDRLTIGAYYSENHRTEYLRAYYEVDGKFSEDKLNCGTNNTMFCGTLPVNSDTLRSGVGNRPDGLFAASEPASKLSNRLFRVSLDYDLSDAFKLHYLYGNVKGQAQEDFSFASNTYNPTGKSVISQQHEGGKIDYNSHELRLAYDDGGPIKGDFGYFRSRTRDRFAFGIRLVSPGTSLTRLSSNPLDMTGMIGYTNTDAEYATDSVFMRASYSFLDDKAKISAEGRYSYQRISFNDILARTKNPDLPLLQSDYDDFVPRVTAEYHLSHDNMLYASAAKGIKAGGFNGYVSGSTTLTTKEQSFGEESNWTYEIGSKNSFFNHRLTFNIDAFYIDWSNKQAAVVPSGYDTTNISLGTTPPSIYESTGSARSWGIELDGQLRVMRQLSLTYSANYTNAKYRKGAKAVNYIGVCDNVVCPADGSIGGNYIEGAPSVSAAGGFEWRDHLNDKWDYFAGLDATYQNRQYVDPENLVKIAGYTLFDGRVGVENDHWKIFAWGKNLFDHKYIQNSFEIISLRQYAPSYGDRATYGITASMNF